MKKRVPIVAIVGSANAGKSSLYNSVLGRRAAITAEEAGTTRDAVWSQAHYQGKDFWLIDTAGMKRAEDDFELTIQEQIIQAADSADIIWVVADGGSIITDEDRAVAKLARSADKPVVLVVNKSDKLKSLETAPYRQLGIEPILFTSTTQGKGIAGLLDATADKLPAGGVHDDTTIGVALIGRPNVGKSSLFNALATKQQAVVADVQGTTRDVNRSIVRYNQQAIELLDTAGIRRQGKVGRGVEYFSGLRTIAAIEQSRVCLLILDAHEPSVQLDQKIAGMVKEANRGLVIVVTKWDSLEKDPYTRDHIARQLRYDLDFVPWAPLIFVSSVTGQNVTKLFDLIIEIADRSKLPSPRSS
jgi:GTPase